LSKKPKKTESPKATSNVVAVLGKIEWGTAIVLTAVLLYFHVVLWRHAGGLWRDEQNTVYISTLPSFSQIWANLSFDSFPIFWFSVIRCWSAFGFNSDLSFRFLGLLVGLSLVAALWWNSRQFKQSVPLVALAFLGFNPTVIYWGDSLRAYGIGALFGILIVGSLWRYLFNPTKGNALLAAVFALLGVQTLYYNTILLLAFGLAGALVAARRRWWKRAGVILGIGTGAAISLIPYAETIHRYGETNKVQHFQSFTLEDFFQRFSSAVETSGINNMVWIWLGVFVLAGGVALWLQFLPEQKETEPARKDVTWYFAVALLIGVLGYFLFLKWVKLPTNPWHYILLLTIVSVALEGIFSAWIKNATLRITRLILVIGLILLMWPMLQYFSHLRQTNADLIAAQLKEQAQPQDLIVVFPWYFNVSFKSYYHGAARTVTIPPMPDPRVHRYDLVAEALAKDASSVIEPVLNDIRETLKSGHKVWIVGLPTFENVSQPIPTPPPAPQMPSGWLDDPYYEYWSMRLGQFLGQHSGSLNNATPASPNPVTRLETPALLVSGGWRD
jgi:hypothetical protein